ncbi:MAG: assimilatory nitrate reductase alpha subunit apoprotein [Hyphomicrobiales bacterium]|nr:assimilatory nitrate reductase alpha subunit apoprotein [Hyphomicrobiales bacterium]
MNAPLVESPAVKTTCPYCGVGCGVLTKPDGMGGAVIAGDPQHPANFGRLCSKGSALGETLALEQRLLHPMLLTRSGSYERTSWDNALDVVAQGFQTTIAQHGPDATAFYLSGQLLTEDYYVANKLMKGYLGTANVDTNSRLCMASSVAGHKRAFGADAVPGNYTDLDQADLIVLVGSNAAWCHPILFQRMLKNRAERGAKIIVIDPRRTASVEEADLFLPVAPGMDSILFSALFMAIAERRACDADYMGAHTQGYDAALASARELAPNLDVAAARAGIDVALLQSFIDLWIGTPKVVTAWSQGVNQSAQGTDKVDAIINCHLATGRIGKPGLGPFSLTGQPNAMGGREVGGLANMLAAHMGFAPQEVDRVQRFWSAPRMATREGLKAVAMFDAIASGDIRALWVMATNPAVSLPRADHVRTAMKGLDLFVVSEVMRSNDTVNCGAHVLLPAAAWAEKDGTVTNSERRISRQRSFLPLPGDVRPDWWIVCEVAKRLGFGDAFAFGSAGEIFAEHARLSAFENDGTRDFDIGALAFDEGDYQRMQPVQWPAPAGAPLEDKILFRDGQFFTPDRKARFTVVEAPALKHAVSAAFPLMLNTGRVRDQWHTMTRTGLSPRLGAHLTEPFVEVHPDDALSFALADGGFARVASEFGSAILRVRVSEGQRRGEIFAPIHWSAETSSDGRVGALVQPSTDRYSGQPELKATAASMAPVEYARHGFVLARDVPELGAEWWSARVAVGGGHGALLATELDIADCASFVHGLFAGAELAEFQDADRGLYRVAAFVGGRLIGAFFIAPTGEACGWDAVKAMFAAEDLGATERKLLLSGRDASGVADAGPTVCACFGVGLATIRDLVASGVATSAEAIGACLKAGTNCGSCVPELRKIIATHAPKVAA